MKKCNDNCLPVCDFCKLYTDYSILKGLEEFQGIGVCEADNTEVLASDSCYNNFHCFNVED